MIVALGRAMSNRYPGLVNQKLFFAKEQLRLAQDAAQSKNPQLVQGFLESSLVQLQRSAVLFYREIAVNYRLDDNCIAAFDDLLTAAASTDLKPAEVAELELLSADPASWLGTLKVLDATWLTDRPKPSISSASLAVDLSSSSTQEMTIEQCLSCCGDLENTVNRLRSAMSEW